MGLITTTQKEMSNMLHDYKDLDYTGFRFGKYDAVFTDLRIDRKTLPCGVFAYDIRHSDSGSFVTVENHVWANHAGTILTVVPVKMPKGRDYYTLRDWTFTESRVPVKEVDKWIEDGKKKLITIRSSYFFKDVLNSPAQMPYNISTIPMSESWKANLTEKWWFSENIEKVVKPDPAMAKLIKLRDVLLSFGGEEVCLPDVEEDIDAILSRGQVWMGDKVDVMKGKPSRCHSNSAACWDANKNKSTIATGYALSEDGLWRQHSWVIHLKPRQNRVVETTTKRLIYFGFAMTESECEDFYYYNN